MIAEKIDPKTLETFVAARRWFRSKSRVRTSVRVEGVLPIGDVELALVQVELEGEGAETYLLPLARGDGPVDARIDDGVVDALQTGRFAEVLIDAVRANREIAGEGFALRARAHGSLPEGGDARVLSGEQTNTNVMFGDRMVLKVYRRLIAGENPDVEILRALAHSTVRVPRLLGEVEWTSSGTTAPVAMIQSFVKSRGDAWKVTLSLLESFLSRATGTAPALPTGTRFDVARRSPPSPLADLARESFDLARTLGRRTGELHRALAEVPGAEFLPEPVSDVLALVEDTRRSIARVLERLHARRDLVPEEARDDVDLLLSRREELEARVGAVASRPVESLRIRIHGDFHLGQVLVEEQGDVVIIDFEGEPARTLEERRAKALPLRDVAGMLRSFDYAAASVRGDRAFCDAWTAWASAAFLGAWREAIDGSPAAPADDEEAAHLLDLFLIDKGIYEVGYELDNRPAWIAIPVRGLLALLDARA